MVQFTKEVIESYILRENFYPKSIDITPIKKIKNNSSFVPRKTDELFWIFYIIINGFSQYELIGSNGYEIEKTEKYRLIELLREKEYKQILKHHKITKIKEDIEDDLGHKERISYKTFFALCYTHKLNILFIHRQKCFKIVSENAENNFHVIIKYDPPKENRHGNYKYVYITEHTQEEREKYMDEKKYFQWETIDKPLRAISYYKVKDLIDICILHKLKEDEYIKKTKQEVYDLLLEII
jgi:hypothetical protein